MRVPSQQLSRHILTLVQENRHRSAVKKPIERSFLLYFEKMPTTICARFSEEKHSDF